MKHSNFHAKVNKVKSLEQAELKKAAELVGLSATDFISFLPMKKQSNCTAH